MIVVWLQIPRFHVTTFCPGSMAPHRRSRKTAEAQSTLSTTGDGRGQAV